MLNFAGQVIDKRTWVAQIARTNQGIVRRVGVVLDVTVDDEGISHLRTAWYDPETPDVNVMESVVALDNLVAIDPMSLPTTIRVPLEYAVIRGRAAL